MIPEKESLVIQTTSSHNSNKELSGKILIVTRPGMRNIETDRIVE